MRKKVKWPEDFPIVLTDSYLNRVGRIYINHNELKTEHGSLWTLLLLFSTWYGTVSCIHLHCYIKTSHAVLFIFFYRHCRHLLYRLCLWVFVFVFRVYVFAISPLVCRISSTRDDVLHNFTMKHEQWIKNQGPIWWKHRKIAA